jgi:hypothetical protein
MKLQTLLTVSTLSLSLQAGAACVMPLPSEVPVIPDGSTASQVEMDSAQRRVNAYVAAIEQFLDCRGERLPNVVYNGLVMRAEEVADDYNDALKTYVSRQSTVADN